MVHRYAPLAPAQMTRNAAIVSRLLVEARPVDVGSPTPNRGRADPAAASLDW